MVGDPAFIPDIDDLAEEQLDAASYRDIVGFWTDDEDDTPAWYWEQYDESNDYLTF